MVRRLTFDHLVERSGSAPAWLRYGWAFGLVLLDSVLKAMLVPLSAGNFRLMLNMLVMVDDFTDLFPPREKA